VYYFVLFWKYISPLETTIFILIKDQPRGIRPVYFLSSMFWNIISRMVPKVQFFYNTIVIAHPIKTYTRDLSMGDLNSYSSMIKVILSLEVLHLIMGSVVIEVTEKFDFMTGII
jgi:small-conductance mechanosensitive channel